MCYSAEVQLTTSLIIFVSVIFFYFYYKKLYSKYSTEQLNWTKPFLNTILLVFLCIGGHQLFEFLSLVTSYEIIYKIGLIISISAMYFMLRSLEILTNKNFYSKFSILIIIGVAIHAFLIPMTFENFSFHLRHYSAFLWASFWIMLYMYWHICAFSIYNKFDKKSKNTLFIYLLVMGDISFILAIIYSIWAYFQFSVNVCTDSPSIWCTFYVIQALFVPVLLSSLPISFNRPKRKSKISAPSFILYLGLSIIILLILISILPYFNCLTWKYIFP